MVTQDLKTPASAARQAKTVLDVLVTAVGEANRMVDLLGEIAKDAKQIPALIQLARIGLTGSNATASFEVRQVIPALEPFVDTRWEFACGDLDSRMTIRPDYTGEWVFTYPTYPPQQPGYIVHTTTFHLVMDGNRPTAIFDGTNDPNGPPKGSKTRSN